MAEEFEIWAEKYRPKTFDEIINQEHVIERVKSFVEEKNLPHMLFAGPAGTGKTTTALVIARTLYGEGWRQNVLELNASDARGIDVIRGRVKDFARTKAIGKVPFKLIILDEADALTNDAQQALRRTMEDFSDITRFILICISPDTKVYLPNEIEIRAEDLQNLVGNHVLGFDSISNKIKKCYVNAYLELNPKEIGKKVLRIKTDCGRELILTEDHPLLTPNGWKLAGLMKEGEEILVFPALEGTSPPKVKRVILDEFEFIKRCAKIEKKRNNKKRFRDLTTIEKIRIALLIRKLYKEIKRGLTKREFEVYKIIKKRPLISRKEIQKIVKLSRVRVNQILKSLEKKNAIKRVVEKKVHRFVVLRDCLKLRNLQDIRKIVKKKLGIEISYSEVKRLVEKRLRTNLIKIKEKLEEKGLLPLIDANEKALKIARLFGFILGDGHLSLRPKRIIISSKPYVLKEIKKELKSLGFKSSKIYRKKLKKGYTYFILVDDRSLYYLLYALGMPIGDNTTSEFYLPDWIKNGSKIIKREFLRGFFDAELSTPYVNKHSFSAPYFVQHKISRLKENLKIFAEDMKKLLEEFGIESKYRIILLDYVRKKDGERVCKLVFLIRPNHKTILKLYSRIGFYFEKKRRILARQISEYLRFKFNLLSKREALREKVVQLWLEGSRKTKIAASLGVTLDFIRDSISGKKVNVAYSSFPTFDEWIKERKFADEIIINKIEEIEEVDKEKVVDILAIPYHSFITNGIISHNCNYSSKIIDPIQSRCVVFRFRAMDEKHVRQFINRIVKKEKLKIDEKAIKAIIDIAEGDLRRVSNLLQASAALTDKITEDVVYEVASLAKPTDIREMIEFAIKGEFTKARDKLIQLLVKQGLAGEDIVRQIHKEIYKLKIPDELKIKLVEKVGEFEFRISEGGDPFVQLAALLAHIALVCKK